MLHAQSRIPRAIICFSALPRALRAEIGGVEGSSASHAGTDAFRFHTADLEFPSYLPITGVKNFSQPTDPDMDHYAADENYFTEEGLQRGHDDLLRKLDEKKREHAQRQAEQKQRDQANAQSHPIRSTLLVVAIILMGLAGGWLLSLFVLT